MGGKGIAREKTAKMTFAIKCGALRQNSTAIRRIFEGKIDGKHPAD
jgi:hypothetical protein